MGGGQNQDIMTLLAELTRAVTTSIDRRVPPQAPQPHPLDTSYIDQFMNQNPPSFSGNVDPTKAENWIMSLEMIFVMMELIEQHKV